MRNWPAKAKGTNANLLNKKESRESQESRKQEDMG